MNPWIFTSRKATLSVTKTTRLTAVMLLMKPHNIFKGYRTSNVGNFRLIRGYGSGKITSRPTNQRWVNMILWVPEGWICRGMALSYEELAPWYSHVEHFADQRKFRRLDTAGWRFSAAWEMNCVESDQWKINAHYKSARSAGRCAIWLNPGDSSATRRNPCQARSECERGCPFWYFGSIHPPYHGRWKR
jgi:hypothetical protein